MKAIFSFLYENPGVFAGMVMATFTIVAFIVLNKKAKKEVCEKSEAAKWLAARTSEELNLLRLWTAFGNRHYGTRVAKTTLEGRAAFPEKKHAAVNMAA